MGDDVVGVGVVVVRINSSFGSYSAGPIVVDDLWYSCILSGFGFITSFEW